MARLEREMGAEDSDTRKRLEALSGAVRALEVRLTAEDTAIRGRIEDRVMEEVAWVLAMVKPLQRSIDKLTCAFHDMGYPHVKCSKEAEALEDVIKDIESRALPWRSVLDREGRGEQDAAPSGKAEPSHPAHACCEPGEPSVVSVGQRPEPKRPASSKPFAHVK